MQANWATHGTLRRCCSSCSCQNPGVNSCCQRHCLLSILHTFYLFSILHLICSQSFIWSVLNPSFDLFSILHTFDQCSMNLANNTLIPTYEDGLELPPPLATQIKHRTCGLLSVISFSGYINNSELNIRVTWARISSRNGISHPISGSGCSLHW